MRFDSLMALLSAFIAAAYFIYVFRVMKADRDISWRRLKSSGPSFILRNFAKFVLRIRR